MDKTKIEQLNRVIGTNWSDNQIQIIVRPNVSDAYEMIQKENGIDDGSVDESLDQNLTKRKSFTINTLLDYITGSLIPLLPVLIGAGFIKVLTTIFLMSGLLSQESSTFIILNFVGDTGFYFLPIFIGQNAAKRLGANPGLGMFIGAMFLHPDFIQLITGNAVNFLGLPIYPASYSSSVFPVLLSVAVMAPIEKIVAKYSSTILRTILEPLLTILIMIPIALGLLGPLGAIPENYLVI